MNIMDYSLLLAVEKVKKNETVVVNSFESTSENTRHGKAGNRDSVPSESSLKNRYLLESQDGKLYYHVAVIDYL